MKDREKKLFTQMILFFFVIILCFGLLIIKSKSDELKSKKIKEKFDEYIEENYKDIKDQIVTSTLDKKKETYYLKVSNKDNDKLYFTISYKDAKFTSSYEEDYLEGKTLLSYYEKKLNDDLNKNIKDNGSTFEDLTISIDTKLNDCTDLIYKRLINNKYNLPIYTVNYEKDIVFDVESINNTIILVNNFIQRIGFNPKSYSFTLTNKNNLTDTVNIKFKSDILDISTLNIGSAIINNDKSVLEKYSIEIKHLN